MDATVIVIDNSEFMRNGDYSPNRYEAQRDAVNILANAKTESNPESTVALMKMAGGCRPLATLTSDVGKILNAMHGVDLKGQVEFVRALDIAQLCLKNRQNKSQKQRIVAFVGSPIDDDKKEMVKVAKKLKKNNVAVDIVNFGEDSAGNVEKLEAFIEAVDASGTSRLLSVPSGSLHLGEVLMASPIMLGEHAGSNGAGNGGGAASATAASGGAHSDFGGIDPNTDPELAMALRMSLEEERLRAQSTTASSTAATPAVSALAVPTATTTTTRTVEAGDSAMATDDDADLAAALAMSVTPSTANTATTSSATASTTTTASTVTTSNAHTTTAMNQQSSLMNLDAGDVSELAQALALSMSQNNGEDDEDEEGDEGDDDDVDDDEGDVVELDEEADLAAALAMSLAATNAAAAAAAGTAPTTTTATSTTPSSSVATAAVVSTTSTPVATASTAATTATPTTTTTSSSSAMATDDDDDALALALAMSTQTPSAATTTTSTAAAPTNVDPGTNAEFLQEVLASLPGVDVNDPQIQAMLASFPRQQQNQNNGSQKRNLVEHLSTTKSAKHIRVADKVMPELAGLSAAQKAIFKNEVDYKQANLNNPAHIAKVFAEDFGKWDVIVNCASETKYSQTEQVYKENIVDLAQRNAVEAAKHSPKVWIELSTGQIYASDKKPRDEDAKQKPWTKMAAAKLAAEAAVQAVSGLKVVVLRLAIVYGPGDQTGMMPRLVCGAVYTTGDDSMTFLWDKDLNIHTVHVKDVCRAITHVASGDVKAGVYNVVDDNDTDQGKMCEHIEALYGIKTAFLGGMKSKLATAVAMKTVADTANDTHLGPWSELCKAKGINTPLTPYLDEELLYNNSLTLDGSKFAATGFKYEHPKMTTPLLKQSIQYFIDNKAFPEGVLKV